MILIDRGLSQSNSKSLREIYPVLSVEALEEECGGDGMMDTPVPIPNTEVKHHSGDDSGQLRQ